MSLGPETCVVDLSRTFCPMMCIKEDWLQAHYRILWYVKRWSTDAKSHDVANAKLLDYIQAAFLGGRVIIQNVSFTDIQINRVVS